MMPWVVLVYILQVETSTRLKDLVIKCIQFWKGLQSNLLYARHKPLNYLWSVLAYFSVYDSQ